MEDTVGGEYRNKDEFRAAMVRRSTKRQMRPSLVLHAASSCASNRWLPHTPQVNALERRLFYIPSFKIYGSVAGFYDYGPPGCAIKGNFTQIWRQHFVLEEGMLEVEQLPKSALPPQGWCRAASDSSRMMSD